MCMLCLILFCVRLSDYTKWMGFRRSSQWNLRQLVQTHRTVQVSESETLICLCSDCRSVTVFVLPSLLLSIRNKHHYHEKIFEEAVNPVIVRNYQGAGARCRMNYHTQYISTNTVNFSFSKLQPSGALPVNVVWKLRQIGLVAQNIRLARR